MSRYVAELDLLKLGVGPTTAVRDLVFANGRVNTGAGPLAAPIRVLLANECARPKRIIFKVLCRILPYQK
jgi:hypothetical protein